ncbi:MAG: iron ABC transporter permease [Betaproteobacteria bacterium]|nr:iron ABC transporter permease [Betaproteobacteria bacterium]
MNPPRVHLVLALLALTALASIGLALAAGSLALTPAQTAAVLLGQGEDIHREVILHLRLPRALAAFACGGLLALAGALMQILLRNPLADPYVLGVSGGAAVGALAAMLLGVTLNLGIQASAFLGALSAMALVFGLSRGDGGWTRTRLLLTGVIVAAGCGALVTLLLSIAPDHQLRGMLFWLMGDAAQAGDPLPALLTLGAGLALALAFARDLNLLARGVTFAATLGANVGFLTPLIHLTASLLTAIAVTSIGNVGFVGLVVPHLTRLALGNDQRLLLPAAVLAGGALLTLADTLARTVIAPQQLPVGAITALIGVPAFLILLARAPRREGL